jgi:hypothetical protein
MALAVSSVAPGELSGDVKSKIVACGVDTRDVSERYDQGRQDEIVTVRRRAVSKSTIACLARVSWQTFIDFEFNSPELQRQYKSAFQATREAKAVAQQAALDNRKWLAQKGLLDGALRIRAEGGSLAARARDVEILCGFPPETVLHVKGQRVYIGPLSDPGKVSFERLSRLTSVAELVFPDNLAIISQETSGARPSKSQVQSGK